MKNTCEQLKQELEDLEDKKKDFDLELEKAIQTGNFEKVRELITHKKQEPEPVVEKQITIKGKVKTVSRKKSQGNLNAAQQYDI